MVTYSTAVDLLRGLSADEIRRRLGELAAEQKALKTLLRAAIQAESATRKSPVKRETPANA